LLSRCHIAAAQIIEHRDAVAMSTIDGSIVSYEVPDGSTVPYGQTQNTQVVS
jgi:hypothetical protein